MFKVSGHCKELYHYLVMLRGEMSTLFALMKAHKTKTLIGFVYRFDFAEVRWIMPRTLAPTLCGASTPQTIHLLWIGRMFGLISSLPAQAPRHATVAINETDDTLPNA